jgi:hypothetical protein
MSKITSLEYRNKMSLIKGGKGDITTDDPIHRHLRYDGSIRNGRGKLFYESRFKLPVHSMFGSENPAWKGGKVKQICIVCEKEFYRCRWQINPNTNRGKFCSLKCLGMWNSKNKIGRNAPDWKGIKCITPIYNRIRASDKYKLWRKSVFERDRWKCLICGKVGRDINAHHIESFKGILEKNNIKTFEEAENCIELWLPENGITLCISCHKLKHSKEGPWAELQENFHI